MYYHHHLGITQSPSKSDQYPSTITPFTVSEMSSQESAISSSSGPMKAALGPGLVQASAISCANALVIGSISLPSSSSQEYNTA